MVRRRERVQVEGLPSPERLQPAARPVDTFVEAGAALPQAQRDAQELAGFVADIVPVAREIATRQAKEIEARGHREAQRFQTEAEIQRAIKAGDIPEAEDPLFRRGLNQGRADKLAREYSAFIQDEFNEVQGAIYAQDNPADAINNFLSDRRRQFFSSDRFGDVIPNDLSARFLPQVDQIESQFLNVKNQEGLAVQSSESRELFGARQTQRLDVAFNGALGNPDALEDILDGVAKDMDLDSKDYARSIRGGIRETNKIQVEELFNWLKANEGEFDRAGFDVEDFARILDKIPTTEGANLGGTFRLDSKRVLNDIYEIRVRRDAREESQRKLKLNRDYRIQFSPRITELLVLENNGNPDEEKWSELIDDVARFDPDMAVSLITMRNTFRGGLAARFDDPDVERSMLELAYKETDSVRFQKVLFGQIKSLTTPTIMRLKNIHDSLQSDENRDFRPLIALRRQNLVDSIRAAGIDLVNGGLNDGVLEHTILARQEYDTFYAESLSAGLNGQELDKALEDKAFEISKRRGGALQPPAPPDSFEDFSPEEKDTFIKARGLIEEKRTTTSIGPDGKETLTERTTYRDPDAFSFSTDAAPSGNPRQMPKDMRDAIQVVRSPDGEQTVLFNIKAGQAGADVHSIASFMASKLARTPEEAPTAALMVDNLTRGIDAKITALHQFDPSERKDEDIARLEAERSRLEQYSFFAVDALFTKARVDLLASATRGRAALELELEQERPPDRPSVEVRDIRAFERGREARLKRLDVVTQNAVAILDELQELHRQSHPVDAGLRVPSQKAALADPRVLNIREVFPFATKLAFEAAVKQFGTPEGPDGILAAIFERHNIPPKEHKALLNKWEKMFIEQTKPWGLKEEELTTKPLGSL